MKTDGQLQVGGALPQGVVVGVVVVFVDGPARHHHADHAHILGTPEILNRAVYTQDRGLRQTQDAVRRFAAHGL